MDQIGNGDFARRTAAERRVTPRGPWGPLWESNRHGGMKVPWMSGREKRKQATDLEGNTGFRDIRPARQTWSETETPSHLWHLATNQTERVSMDKTRGLVEKYQVEEVDDPRDLQAHKLKFFVLDLIHDPHAIPALRAYADSCEADGYSELAADLRLIINKRRTAWRP